MKNPIEHYTEEQGAGRRRTRKYKVVPADIPIKLPKLAGVKAVLWDIYGTLLGHPMGDMVDHSLAENRTRLAFRKTADEFGLKQFLVGDPAVELRRLYQHEIEQDHRRKQEKGITYPEVRIEHIWLKILRKLQKRGYKPAGGEIALEKAVEIAWFFDTVQQFRLPYAGARHTLKTIKEERFHQGIISNAQFYTPLALNIVLRGSTIDEPMKELFNRDLVFFSYRLGVGKPNPLGFEKARLRLMRKGVQPQEVVYVGNDMLYDMLLAHRVGFKCVLFAGDRMGIILRPGSAELADFEPDGVIKELSQVLGIIGIRPA